MSPRDETEIDLRIAAYLDDALSPAEMAEFEVMLREDASLAEKVELFRQIDAGLQRMFRTQPACDAFVGELLDPAGAADPATTSLSSPQQAGVRRTSRRAWYWAVAASLPWLVVGWYFWPTSDDAPLFTPTPLSSLYRETVQRGFRPYYECHDLDRFAATFAQRQGKLVQLAEMPEGRRMLGLSYTGGLSRDTTAMLCVVDEQPVMVFVDRLAADQPEMTRSDNSVLVFRREEQGLVFYEVTPFDEPRAMEFLTVGEP
ncbi:MAG: hypothetical protein KDA60_19195 [Planctomycetales bacterium]|nr:hypothetical protein [Planctomycetales bacterium]